jgi:hypothetical protein
MTLHKGRKVLGISWVARGLSSTFTQTMFAGTLTLQEELSTPQRSILLYIFASKSHLPKVFANWSFGFPDVIPQLFPFPSQPISQPNYQPISQHPSQTISEPIS